MGQELSLQSAQQRAAAAHASIQSARAAVSAALGRERQAGVWSNPNLSYSREQASNGGARSAQDIVWLDQRLELGGQRAARVEAARLRRQSAEARLAAAQADIALEVVRAYASALAADRRAGLAAQAAAAFSAARRTTDARLAAGDISGYTARRLKLEAARYSALSIEAAQERQSARRTLASLIGLPLDSALAVRLAAPVLNRIAVAADSIDVMIGRQALELAAARLEAAALLADARLAQRERTPNPTLLAGYKRESANDARSLNGFVAGVSIPLPVLDRRAGSISAAEAEHRRRLAEAELLARTLVVSARAALDASARIEQQLAALRAELGEEARLALSAAELAYAEGEITLLEWLDAVRAYQEAEAAHARLSAQALIERASLLRSLGLPITEP